MAKLYYGTTHVIPNIQKTITTTLNVVPSQVEQQLTPLGADAYKLINVPAITSSIDANITASNIKNNISILGVVGTATQNYEFVIPRMIDQNGKLIKCNKNYTIKFPSEVKDLATLVLSEAWYQDKYLISADLSNLTSITGSSSLYRSFAECSNLQQVDLSGLTLISASSAMYQTFFNCDNLTTIDLSNVVQIKCFVALGGTFENCRNLTSIKFTNLEIIGDSTEYNSDYRDDNQLSSCFRGCTKLTELRFPKLEAIYCSGRDSDDGTFSENETIQKMYFPKLTTITKPPNTPYYHSASRNIFYGCSSLTELHFAAANQAAIEATAGYSTAWGRGAGNVTIYFDL